MRAKKNPGWRAGGSEENDVAGDTVSVSEDTTNVPECPVTDQDALDIEFDEVVAQGAARPTLGVNVDGIPYTTSTPVLCEVVVEDFLAANDPADLRASAPRDVADDLLGRINDRIALQNRMVKADQLVGVKRAPLARLGFTEVARLMVALRDVAVLVESDGRKAAEMLGMYQPASGLYTVDPEDMRTAARGFRPDLSVKEFADILAAMTDIAPRRLRIADRDLIAVKNGIVDYRTHELMPYSPEHVFMSKCAVAWNPAAENPVIPNPSRCDHDDPTACDDTCRCIEGHTDPDECGDECLTWDVESWMHSLSDDPEIVELLWEGLGAVVRPNVAWHKSLWFYSEVGNNGKGTLLALMRNLLGAGNWISLSLATAGGRFGLAELIGGGMPQAILTDENAVGSFVDSADGIKSLITGDPVRIERKGIDAVSTRWRGVMVQCLNEPPKIRDRSPSFLRRLLMVPFTRSFTGVERKYIKEDYLARPDVLEYVLKRVLVMAPYYELSEPEATKAALTEFRENNDPVASFWAEYSRQFVWDLLPFDFLYELFKRWFASRHPTGKVIGSTTFKRELRNLVAADPMSPWECPDHTVPHRPTTRMAQPELLIAEFDVEGWGNPAAKRDDASYAVRRSTMRQDALRDGYRGFTRKAQDPLAPGVAAGLPATAQAAPKAAPAPVTPAPRSAPKPTPAPTVPGGIVVPPEPPESAVPPWLTDAEAAAATAAQPTNDPYA